MKRILITGSLGQIGSELTLKLRNEYGVDNVVSTDIKDGDNFVTRDGIFHTLDILDGEKLFSLCKKYNIDTIIHLAALLSATGEKNPKLAWDINMSGNLNCLEVSKEIGSKLFIPSSIAVFGETTPKDNTEQDTIMRPSTMYGITKVSGELLCDYYYNKFNVDTRGLRFPGLISYMTLPGGGTTDYAVEIYYKAKEIGSYECYIGKDTYMDMIYMEDALNALVKLMEVDGSKLIHRNSYNISAMSICPEDISLEIKKHIKDFKMSYNVDPIREAIARSWPNSIDSTCAINEWGFSFKYDLSKMTEDMLNKVCR